MKYSAFLILLVTACINHEVHSVKSVTLSEKKSNDLVRPVMNYYLTTKDTVRYAFLKFDPHRDSSLFDKGSSAANLSMNEVKTIERLIIEKATIYNSSHKSKYEHIARPAKYYKQFIAIINSKGEKIVWVNCLCMVIGNSWKKGISVVNDGGSCYFRLKINLTNNVVYDFYTNGLA